MQDSERAQEAKCGLCGEPMPEGEEMFKFHGYSGGCPKPPLAAPVSPVEPEPTTTNSVGSDVAALHAAAIEVAKGTSDPAMERLWTGKAIAYEVVTALLAKKRPTVEPEPCVWREVGLFSVRPLLHPGERDHDKNRVKRYNACPYCGAPLKVEREP